jgi:hypothetical protein
MALLPTRRLVAGLGSSAAARPSTHPRTCWDNRHPPFVSVTADGMDDQTWPDVVWEIAEAAEIFTILSHCPSVGSQLDEWHRAALVFRRPPPETAYLQFPADARALSHTAVSGLATETHA